MPRVPTLDAPQVRQAPLPGVQQQSIATPGMLAGGFEQLGQLGNAVERAGAAAGDVAAAMQTEQIRLQREANQLRVDDALTQAQGVLQSLTFDKDRGFANLRGEAALNRPDGKALPDEYLERANEAMRQIGAGLANDEQRRLYGAHANRLAMRFQADLQKHVSTQFREYALSVDEGRIKNAENAIGLHYNDPERINEAVDTIRASIYRAGQAQGWAPDKIEAEQRRATSRGHVLAVQAALQNNDPAYARQYLERYGEQMDADDALRARGVITKEMDARVAAQTATEAVQSVIRQSEPTPTQQLHALAGDLPAARVAELPRLARAVMGAESGGRRYGADGRLLESPKGAKGEMQVLDGTNRDPGFGVRPAANDSPEERARVGRDYLDAMVRYFKGDTAKGVAAYNAGPGAVDAAVKKAGANWLSALPAETQKYVPNVLARYERGEGAPKRRPTAADVDAAVRAQLGPSATPDQVRLAVADAQRQFNAHQEAARQRDEEAVGNAMRWLDANNGDYAAMPAAIRDAVPGQHRDSVRRFAEQLGRGEKVATDFGLYHQLMTNPEQLRDANLASYRGRLGDTEFKQLINEQQQLRKPDRRDEQRTQLQSASQILDGFMRQAGLDPTPEKKADAERAGRVRAAFSTRIAAHEGRVGRKATEQELRELAADLFTLVNVSTWFGLSSEARSAILVDPEKDALVVPDADRRLIEAGLREAGRPVTEQAIRTYYLRNKGAPRGR